MVIMADLQSEPCAWVSSVNWLIRPGDLRPSLFGLVPIALMDMRGYRRGRPSLQISDASHAHIRRALPAKSWAGFAGCL